MKMTKIFSVLAIFIATLSFAQQSKEQDFSMYPKAQNGFEQKMIHLKSLKNENDYEVELFIGKKTLTDSCNRFFLSGNFEDKTVEGWGYNYYDFKTDGNIGSTLMGCMDNKSVEKTVYAQTIKTRYNSNLPIVVYVPKGYTLEYRIWKADQKLIPVQ